MRMQEQPVALITGASRGIGAAAARELAARGYRLALAARSYDDLAALAGEITQGGGAALPIATDMRRPEEVERLGDLALSHFGRVDALVNNAGVGGRLKGLAQLEQQEIAELLAVNLTAPIALTRALLPQMLARRSGAIIFIGSVAGRIALPTSSIYSASKFGLRGFAHALRRDVGRHGIGVTLVAPGFIDTAMTRELRGIPKAPVELVARAIADAVERPQREVIIPWFYRLMIAFEHLAPWIGDIVLRSPRRM
jgi:short-subunit dehydrogenase